jgi:hypothetical protein
MVLNGMDGYVYVAAPKGDSCPNFLEVVVYFTNQGLAVTGHEYIFNNIEHQ